MSNLWIDYANILFNTMLLSASISHLLLHHLIRTKRSLARDNKHAVEKEQVIKMLRTVVQIAAEHRMPFNTVGPCKSILSESVLRAVVAVAEHAEDPFKGICIQTLAEIRKRRLFFLLLSDAQLCTNF
jgi:Rapamycin-insensitive companion of mTOR, N-term